MWTGGKGRRCSRIANLSCRLAHPLGSRRISRWQSALPMNSPEANVIKFDSQGTFACHPIATESALILSSLSRNIEWRSEAADSRSIDELARHDHLVQGRGEHQTIRINDEDVLTRHLTKVNVQDLMSVPSHHDGSEGKQTADCYQHEGKVGKQGMFASEVDLWKT